MAKARKWTDTQVEYLRENYGKVDNDIIATYLGYTECAIKAKAAKIGLKIGTKKYWSDWEIQYLREHYPTSHIQDLCELFERSEKSVYMQAFLMGLAKDDKFKRDNVREKMSPKFLSFAKQKGCIAHNKGVPMSKEKYEKCAPTMFKKGQTPAKTNPVGTIFFWKGGDVWIRTGFKQRELYHRYVWKQHNGEIPKDRIVSFIDGNSKNCDISNLQLISRADNMARNSINRYPVDLKSKIFLLSWFRRKINKFKKQYNASNFD